MIIIMLILDGAEDMQSVNSTTNLFYVSLSLPLSLSVSLSLSDSMSLSVSLCLWWEDSIREWTGLEFDKSQRAVENREKWRKLVAKSSVVPQGPSRLRDWWWWWWPAHTVKATGKHLKFTGVVYSLIHSSSQWWDSADSEVKVHSAEKSELSKVVFWKRQKGQNVGFHALPTTTTYAFQVHSVLHLSKPGRWIKVEICQWSENIWKGCYPYKLYLFTYCKLACLSPMHCFKPS